MTAPVGALTASPLPRTVKAGLVWPSPPADVKLRGPGWNRPVIAMFTLMVLGGGAAAVGGAAFVWVAPLLAVAPFLVLRRQVRRANARLGASGSLIQHRKLRDAEESLLAIARAAGGNKQVHGLALLQLAGVYSLRGEPQRALELLCVVNKNTSVRRMQPHLAELIPFHIARAFALLGEIDAAEGWLAHGQKRRNFLQEHTADVVQALVRARQGRHADAVALLDKHWQLLETSATGDAMKAQRAVLAFCLEKLGADNEKRCELLLAGARPFGDEVRGIAWPWPDMMEFLRRRVPDEVIADPR